MIYNNTFAPSCWIYSEWPVALQMFVLSLLPLQSRLRWIMSVFVSRITQKIAGRISLNVLRGCYLGQGPRFAPSSKMFSKTCLFLFLFLLFRSCKSRMSARSSWRAACAGSRESYRFGWSSYREVQRGWGTTARGRPCHQRGRTPTEVSFSGPRRLSPQAFGHNNKSEATIITLLQCLCFYMQFSM